MFCPTKQRQAGHQRYTYKERALHNLEVAGVQHHAHGSTQAAGGKVGEELGLDGSNVSMGAHDAAPDGPEGGALLQRLGLVDVGNALPQVEVGLGLAHDAVDFQDGGVVLLVGFGAMVAQDPAGDVQADLLTTHGC